MCNFSVAKRAFNTSSIIKIHKYLMKNYGIKCMTCTWYTMTSLKSFFMGLLIQPTFISLYPNQYSQEFEELFLIKKVKILC